MTARFIALILAALLGVGGCSQEPPQPAAPGPEGEAAHVGDEACSGCHAAEHDAWQGSHHDLAMTAATPATVIGDFDNAHFSYAGIETRFFRRDDKFFVATDGADGQITEFPVAWTFGVEPLQQYLIEFPDGRLQALSICWDSRPAAVGGQRWFHLYPDEAIDHEDPLHWTGPMQNWNFMCAECHSTDYRRGYDVGNDTFSPQWASVDVSCEACHGPASRHVDRARRGDLKAGAGLLSLAERAPWVMNPSTGIAERAGPRRPDAQLAVCARCHSRRSTLSEDYVHGRPPSHTHRTSLLTEGLYHADGQILDEVYVYGSFLQSAMHGAGVTCSDCHEPHSLELRADGNALCGQCHLATVFDTSKHHHHSDDSAGAQCVGCHMPERTYMQVDRRRDHSFRVPRPDLAKQTGAPDACTDCHSNQSATWAAGHLHEWGVDQDTDHFGVAIAAGRRGELAAVAPLVELADQANVPGIVRATAVALLARYGTTPALEAVQRAMRSRDPMVRAAAADAAGGLAPQMRVAIAGTLLYDKDLAVRVAAAGALASMPPAQIPPALQERFGRARMEYEDVQELFADRAESQVNLGVLRTAEGDLERAASAYQRAIEILPIYAPAHINLADVLRIQGRDEQAVQVLQAALDTAAESAELHHALGLAQARQRDYPEAVAALRKAVELQPDATHYAYVLGVALNSTGQSAEALRVLETALRRAPANRQLLVALATMSRDAGLLREARGYANQLLELDPADRAARQLMESLQPSQL